MKRMYTTKYSGSMPPWSHARTRQKKVNTPALITGFLSLSIMMIVTVKARVEESPGRAL